MLLKNRNGTELDLQLFSGKSEVNNAINCLLSVFGSKENYYHPERFDAEYLENEIEKGNLVLYVGKTKEDGVSVPVITISLLKSLYFNKAYEFSTLAVYEKYRGFHASEAFTKMVLEDITKKGESLFYAYAVMFHPHSTITLYENGFVPTGFVPGISRADKFLSQLKLNSQKHTYAIFVKNDKTVTLEPIYVPLQLADLTREVYESLGESPVIETAGDSAARTVTEHNYDSINETLFVYVFECGTDLPDTVNRLQVEYNTSLFSSIIFLNINEPSAVYGFEVLKNLGYAFNGFMPLCGKCEFAVFTKTDGVYIDYDELQMTDELKSFYERIKG